MSRSKLAPHRGEIATLLRAGVSQRELSKRYGVAKSTMDDFIKTNKLRTSMADGEGDLNDAVSDVDVMAAELKDLRKRVTRVQTGDVEFERVLREVRSAVNSAPVIYAPPPAPDAQHKPHVQALLLSDLHAGEIVDPTQVNGLNEYNWSILVQRMTTMRNSLLSFQASRPYPIAELHQWWLGDMVGGAHHEELAITNEFPPAEQAYRVGMLLGQWVEGLVPFYPVIHIKAVPGNHGRVPKKPGAKQSWNSFDWLAYKIAEVYLADYIEAGSVTLETTRGAFLVTEIAGIEHLLWHGDGVRSSMPGIPWGGVMRRGNELRKTYAELGHRIKAIALGHFHQACVVPGIYMNASVKGPDEWSLKQFGSAEPPEQLLLTFDPAKKRRTDVSSLTP